LDKFHHHGGPYFGKNFSLCETESDRRYKEGGKKVTDLTDSFKRKTWLDWISWDLPWSEGGAMGGHQNFGSDTAVGEKKK